MGEPIIQMLPAFHYAGVSSKNVTLGGSSRGDYQHCHKHQDACPNNISRSLKVMVAPDGSIRIDCEKEWVPEADGVSFETAMVSRVPTTGEHTPTVAYIQCPWHRSHQVIGFDGSHVHLALLYDLMTHRGSPMAITLGYTESIGRIQALWIYSCTL